MGAPPFTKLIQIAYGGIALRASALQDSGAGGTVFAHPRLQPVLMSRLRVATAKFKPITVTGHDGRKTGILDTAFKADLVIDGHRVPSVFVFCNTGKHDIIMGRQWYADNKVLLDCANRRLIWPDAGGEYNAKRNLVVEGSTYKYSPEIQQKHQYDADSRDKRFNQDIQRRLKQGLKRTLPREAIVAPIFCDDSSDEELTGSDSEYEYEYDTDSDFDKPDPVPIATTHRGSWSKDQASSMRKMTAELHPKDPLPKLPKKPKRKWVSREQLLEAGVDVSTINGTNFLRHARQKETILGTTSIHEIDKMIQDKREAADFPPEPDPDEEIHRIIREKLPEVGWAGASVTDFSKRDSDVLVSHRHGVDHDIELTAENPLRTSPLYGMSLEQLKLCKTYIEEHLKKGFIVPSNAPFGSPVLFAKKPGGGWRFCVDYRKLNEVTKKDKYPIPLIEETLSRLARAKVYTKLDIRQAFYRIRMKQEIEDLTTFRTRYGSYKYKVLPFGLTNGPSTWQRFINQLLLPHLDDFCTAYLDDILIYSEDPLEHEEHVRKVLKILRDNKLQVDIKKSEFCVTETKYLGFIITTKGIRMDPDKVSVVQDWPVPTTLKSLQSFLGFCNFYRTFLPDFGRVARPLTKLLKQGCWERLGTAAVEAFERVKELILSDQVRAHYDYNRLTRMETDASDGVVGGVLYQLQDDMIWRPICFYSKTMSPAEMRYPIHDKEMLAVMMCLKEWRKLLVGLQKGPFAIITDHRALEYFTTKQLLNPRQARWADELCDFNFRLTYRPGSFNVVADALTRKHEEVRTQKAKDIEARQMTLLDPSHVLGGDDTQAAHAAAVSIAIAVVSTAAEITELLPVETNKSPENPSESETDVHDSWEIADRILHLNRTDNSMQPLRDNAALPNCRYQMKDGLLLHKERLFVPATNFIRTQLIKAAHATTASAHPGKTKTRQNVMDEYYWPGMSGDIDTYVANCKICRRTHAPRDKKPGLLRSLPVPDRPWQHVAMDFKSFPRDKKGYNNVFVVIDRFGKRAFSLPCHKTVTAQHAADLYYRYIWRIFGPPETAVSDRGPQFISAWMNELSKLTGVKQKLSTAFHPQTDGQTENFNMYMDQRLRPFINYHQDNWSDLLPAMDWAQATLPHESTGLAPYQIEMGIKPRLHWNWRERTTDAPTAREQMTREEAQQYAKVRYDAFLRAREIAQAGIKAAQERQAAQANKHRREPNFKKDDMVFVVPKNWDTGRPSRKLDHQMRGPWKILDQIGHSYEVDLPNSMKVYPVFHADRLRKAADNPLPGQEDKPEPPIEINGTPEYVVEQVLNSRVLRGKLQYQVDWQGYDPDATWYYAHGFIGAPHKLRDYHEAYPNKPGPPVRLKEWLQAWEAEEDLGRHPDDDKPSQAPRKHPHPSRTPLPG